MTGNKNSETLDFDSGPVKCSIVIRAYNEEKHIGRLLEGISQQTFKNFEIILVDSGSIDATVSIAKRYSVKIVTIEPENFTFGYSLNRGIDASIGEYVVIVSAHVYPIYEDWLGKLLQPFEDPNVALVYGKQRGSDNSKFSEKQIFNQWYPNDTSLKQQQPFCNNANAVIRRLLWIDQPYNEELTGLEDIAWAKSVIENGYHLAYCSEAEIVHVHNENPKGVYNRYKREAMAFNKTFPEDTFYFLEFLRMFFTNVISDLWHAVRERVFLKSFISIWWFRFMQFYGTYRGYQEKGPLTDQLKQTFYYPIGFKGKKSQNYRSVPKIDYSQKED